ncbi:MAG: tetratricopeptide repeat protein [Oscillatoriales cyanobacterium]|nr:MAG: tetratricopeptide repeat protein [Oscillatoriales cyanobacterium]TAH17962.1 MAG: tetratricopeptide repeat protein [Oscillatoriales cyanobacterium]
MALLEGVAEGWSRGTIQGFLIGSKINDAEWVNWLQEFGERLLVSPETHLELGGRMVRLGEMNCGRISEVAGKIGRELLAGESLNRNPAEESSQISEDTVPPLLARESGSVSSTDNSVGDLSAVIEDILRLLARESLSVSSTDNSSATNQSDSTSQAKSIEREISQEAKELYNQGVDRYHSGDLGGAIAAYEKALEIDPKFHIVWKGLGNALKELGRYTEAIAAYEKALEIDPKYHGAWYGLGNALNDLGRNTEAKAAYEKALEIDSKDHDAWNGLGVTLKGLGRYSEAIAAYEKALEIDPKDHYAWSNLGIALKDLGRYTEAIAAFDKALDIDPKDHYAWNGLGATLRGLGRYTEAIAAYEKALEFTGDQFWEAWDNRGWAFFFSGRYFEAIQNWDEGLQKYLPSNRDYRLACGKLHYRKGQVHYEHGKQTFTYFDSFHKAKASYEQAREFLKSPLIPETYLEVMQGLITVCHSLGDPKTRQYLTEATTVLETLLLDNETDPEIKQRLQRKFAGLYQLEVDTLVESGDKINALEKAEARKNFCLQWMRAASPNRTNSPTYPEIRDLLTNNTETAIIYWHLSPVSLTAFIITPDKFEVIATPLCDLFPRDNSQSLEKWLKHWKTNYQTYCETGKKPSKQQSEKPNKESHPWRQSMTAELPQLADILKIPEICTHLTNIQHLILIPHRDLHLLPLHILFSDNLFTITYLPSIQVGIDRLDRKPSPSMSLLLVESPDPLLFAEIEAPAIANFYLNCCNTIPSSQATTDNLKEALQQTADIFHFTGHAYHNTKQPSQSALILKKKQPITSEEIAKLELKSYYLVCLSACETGITGKEELIDEFVGLASSFLAAGAVYALSTLWIVDEISTALMMIRFYQILNEQRCQNKLHPALALKEAQKWLRTITYNELSDWYLKLSEIMTANSGCSEDLRDLADTIRRDRAKMEDDKPPYADLYHWAGFTITGKVNP